MAISIVGIGFVAPTVRSPLAHLLPHFSRYAEEVFAHDSTNDFRVISALQEFAQEERR